MTETPPTNPYSTTPSPMRPEDEKLWAVLTHLGGILAPVIVPLIAYLILRDRGPFIRHHTITAVNFHLTMGIGLIIGSITTWLIIGGFILFAVGALILVLGIMAAVAAGRGTFFTYPISITFIR
jgi:uncharacterized protein